MTWIRYACLVLICLFCTISKTYAQIDTEFWFAAPDITSAGGRDVPVYLRITSFGEASTVTISQPAGGGLPVQTINLSANSSATVNLTPWLASIECSANAVQGRGIRISATAQISAYYEVNNNGLNPEFFVLKGRNALGNQFFISSQNTGSNSSTVSPAAFSSFTIVASQDNTSVTITPSKAIVGRPAGIPFTITLNRGQSYSAVAASNAANQHLEGSIVNATRPVAIMLADDFLSNPGQPCADLIGDQTIPVNMLGTEYIATKGY